jgi:hypothetical protein
MVPTFLSAARDSFLGVGAEGVATEKRVSNRRLRFVQDDSANLPDSRILTQGT